MIGRHWKATPLKETKGRLSILALHIEITPLNIHDYVNHDKAVHLLHQIGLDKLNPIVCKSLSTLPEWDSNEPFATPGMDMIGLYIVIGLLVVILPGIVIYYYKMRNKASVKAAMNKLRNVT